MTPGGRITEYPFWSYLDLMMFVGVLAPCLGVSLIAGALITPFVGSMAANWTAQLVMYVLVFLWLWLLLKVRYDQPFWESLAWSYPGPTLIAYGAAGPLLAIGLSLLGAAMKAPQIEMPFKKLLEGPWSLALFGVFSVILGPLAEELVFRGFIMPLVVRSFGPVLGIIFTALPFGLLHGAQYQWVWQYVLMVTLSGVAFGLVRYTTHSTMASTVLHAGFNLMQFAALVVGGVGT